LDTACAHMRISAGAGRQPQYAMVFAGEHQAIMKKGGWSREQVQNYCFEHSQATVAELKRCNVLPDPVKPEDERALFPVVETPQDLLVFAAGGDGDGLAIVTGASTLIGEGVVRAFAAAGTKVVMADINEADGKRIANEIGDDVAFVRTDITSDADIDACIAFGERTFGGVDILINLASTYLDNGIGTNREDWLASLNVNLVSAMVFCDKVTPVIAKRGGGAIVNFASISGKRAQPGRMTYSAAKAALLQVTRNAAMQLQPRNIRVNSVSPGWTWSNIMVQLTGGKREKADNVAAPFHLLRRTGDPSEVAAAVLFLCSDEASFITGTDIAVDGGYTAMGPERIDNAVSKLAE
ncbi:MAG: SDR family oxidoreductase, partial [Propylenella sp.]